MLKTEPPKIGDLWHRVDGTYIDTGSEQFEGMALDWQTWRVTKVTRCGVWLSCVEYPYKKKRFALISGARAVSRTKPGALLGLVARKRRHIAIVEHQLEAARQTLELAKAELEKMKGGAL